MMCLTYAHPCLCYAVACMCCSQVVGAVRLGLDLLDLYRCLYLYMDL
jgi:hypothetical protein